MNYRTLARASLSSFEEREARTYFLRRGCYRNRNVNWTDPPRSDRAKAQYFNAQ
jgi:hypothetical protein